MQRRSGESAPTEEISHIWIAMRDGVRLAARIWLPADARDHPVPAILEYIPYRKNDCVAPRDSEIHPYFAAHGYAGVRVDIRGTGDSEGVLTDEYTETELEDGCDVLRWLAAQPWCTGRVGMLGISWGGFNGLQIAARRPPELGAVVTVCSTDDRYSDDVHHMGGCLLTDNPAWAATMFATNSLPPDPAVVGDAWRSMWHRRLAGSGYWLETWLRHQRRDAFWEHGSVCEAYDAIAAPVYAVSGWADGYSDAVFRLLANLNAPCKGLIGPWSHAYPNMAAPGPRIGFLGECLRWFDHWLKDRDTGIAREPALRLWMTDSCPPATRRPTAPGRWVAEPGWPAASTERRRYALAPGGLTASATGTDGAAMAVQSPVAAGLNAGKWCAYQGGPDLPGDQRIDDGGALVLDGPALSERTEICGFPEVRLDVAADAPSAMLAVRLSDVRPDGTVTRITYGVLNLTHRHSHAHPEPLTPDAVERVRVPLHAAAYAMPAGHRLRLAISSSYWPVTWPSPAPVRLAIQPGTGELDLPVRPPQSQDADLAPFPGPDGAAGEPREQCTPDDNTWTVLRDVEHQAPRLDIVQDSGRVHLTARGLTFREHNVERYSCTDTDPLSARVETTFHRELIRDGWHVATRTRTVLTADAETFHLHADLNAYESGEQLFADTWSARIPRDLV